MKKAFEDVIYYVSKGSLTISLGPKTVTVSKGSDSYNQFKAAIMKQDILLVQKAFGKSTTQELKDLLNLSRK
jgi:hypothetical protein